MTYLLVCFNLIPEVLLLQVTIISCLDVNMASSTKTGKTNFFLFACYNILYVLYVEFDSCSNEIVRSIEVNVLRAEMKQCTDQVEKLTREFSEMKKEVEAAREEVDTTRFVLTEITSKLKEIL